MAHTPPILIVEDDPMMAHLVKATLERAGHSVEHAKDLATARRAVATTYHAMILLDLNLPDGSGLDFLRHVRKELSRPTPVIILSALKQEQTVARGLEIGANDYVTKPISPQALLSRIQIWLAA